MIYHYCDRDSAGDILRDKIIRAHPVLVRTHLDPRQGKEISLAPACWFTISAEPSPTVLGKLIYHGWPVDQPGMIHRFGVPDELAVDLCEWAWNLGYDPQLFRWMLLTAHLSGENWEDWRITSEGVDSSHWQAHESFDPATGVWTNERS